MWRLGPCFGRGRNRRARIYRSHTKDQQIEGAEDGGGNYGALQKGGHTTSVVSLSQNTEEQDYKRDALILAATPACFTVVSLDDRQALRQNLTSRRWMGDRVRKRPAPPLEGAVEQSGPPVLKRRASHSRQGGAEAASCGPVAASDAEGEDLLALIFKHEPEALVGMLQELVNEGDVWKGVVRVPPFIELSPSDAGAPSGDDGGVCISSCSDIAAITQPQSAGGTADGAAAAAASPQLPPTPLPLTSAIEYIKSPSGSLGSLQQQQQQQHPMSRIRKLFQRFSRGSSAAREFASLESAGWSGAPAERTEGGAEGAAADAGGVGGFVRMRFDTEQGAEGSSVQQRLSHQQQQQNQIQNQVANVGTSNHLAPTGAAPSNHRDSKVMRLSDMMMSMLLEGDGEESGAAAGAASELQLPPMRAPSVTRRTSLLVRAGSSAHSANLEGSTGCGFAAGRVHGAAAAAKASSQPLVGGHGGKAAAAVAAAGGCGAVAQQRLERGSLPRRRSSGYMVVGGGGGGSPALHGSDSFSRPTTNTMTSRSTPSATNPNVGSAATSGGVAPAGADGGGASGAVAVAAPPPPPQLRDANPLSTSTLTLSLVRRACMSNVNMEGEAAALASQTESAFGSFTGSNRSRRGRLRRVVSCYDSNSRGSGAGAPNASHEDSQVGADDEVADDDVVGPPLPARPGSSVGTGLLSSLGVGETAHYINASARLLTFAAHLKSAPMATQMLAGVAPLLGGGSIAAAAAASSGGGSGGGGGSAANATVGGGVPAAAAAADSDGGLHSTRAMRTASMPCMEAMMAGARGAAIRGSAAMSVAAPASPPVSMLARYGSAPSAWPRSSVGRFLTSSMPHDAGGTDPRAGSGGSPSSTGGGVDPRVGGGADTSDVVHSGARQEDSMSSFLLLPGSSAGKILGTCSSVAQPCGSSANTLRLEPWYRPAGHPDHPGQRGFGSSTLPQSSTQGSVSVSLSNPANVSIAAAAAGTAAAAAATAAATASAGGRLSGFSARYATQSHNHHGPHVQPNNNNNNFNNLANGQTNNLNNSNNQMLYGTGTWSNAPPSHLRPPSALQPPSALFPGGCAPTAHGHVYTHMESWGSAAGQPSMHQQPISLQPPSPLPQQPPSHSPLPSQQHHHHHYQQQQQLHPGMLSHPPMQMPLQARLQAAAERHPPFAARVVRSPSSRLAGGSAAGAAAASVAGRGSCVSWGEMSGEESEYGNNSSRGGGGGRRYILGDGALLQGAAIDPVAAGAAADAAATAAAAAAAAAGRHRGGASGVGFSAAADHGRASRGDGAPTALGAAADGQLGPASTAVAAAAAAVSSVPVVRGGGVPVPVELQEADRSSEGGAPRRHDRGRMADGVIGMLRQALASQDRGAVSRRNSADECWHEIWATRASDPVTGKPVVVLVQHDVTAKVIAERHLALVMETEHRLLEQLFPRHILAYITEDFVAKVVAAAAGSASAYATVDAQWRPTVRDCKALATWHPQVTLLFADIKGFTPMCKEVEPPAVMAMLNDLYSRYDQMLDEYGVFKVETIGDCYFVAGGLIAEDEHGMATVRDNMTDPLHAQKVFDFARAMLAAAQQVRMPTSGEPVQIRIGIHTGPVVSGVVGTRMPRFCLFGDTVNTASRMESTGEPGGIHASEATYSLLRGCASWNPTGGIQVKGKGLLQTYLHFPNTNPPGSAAGAGSNRPTSSGHRLQIQSHSQGQQQSQDQQVPFYVHQGQQGPTPAQGQGQMVSHQYYHLLERDSLTAAAARPAAAVTASLRPSVSSAGTGTGSVRSGTGSGAATPLRSPSSGVVLAPLDCSQRSSYAELPAAGAGGGAAAAEFATAAAAATVGDADAATAAAGPSGPVDSIDADNPTDPMTTCMDLITAAAVVVANATGSGSAPAAIATGGSGRAPRSASSAQHGPMNLFCDSDPSGDTGGLRPSFEGFPRPLQANSGDRSSTPPVTTRVGAVRTAAGRLLESALAVLNWEPEHGEAAAIAAAAAGGRVVMMGGFGGGGALRMLGGRASGGVGDGGGGAEVVVVDGSGSGGCGHLIEATPTSESG
ncbi:hypothetical protein PLESTB_001781800 [Pleodorina starrii]|uniref:Guanylate cyclase domain-containing protein n=1 Tax=Pleodorina starrii TaxID=330485 RepID=A0A9W6FAA7_9CHLO|nr:hypothetical protein PLESTM_000803200 [Pleodorina starrii]GLC61605.1 hypothetical protein PLESTB_001781800 [Pleodorina starrii]GLC70215.1 hypothetical protein PLESTF_000939400 [Pleodorina starrii]